MNRVCVKPGKRYFARLFLGALAVWAFLFCVPAYAQAEQISVSSRLEENVLTVTAEEGISALYIEFDTAPGAYNLDASGLPAELRSTGMLCGENGFLHEFIDLTDTFGSVNKIMLIFSKKPSVRAVYGFSSADVPEWVQQWRQPSEEADLLLFSSHADDEQLFFSGILPYYTKVRGFDVQVAYATDHEVLSGRQHERLDGLWAVGVTRYPLSSGWPDLYSDSAEGALANLRTVTDGDGVISWIRSVTEQTHARVVVSHDLNGEYGHGMHKLISGSIVSALAGGWAEEQKYLQKVYLHLNEDAPIKLGFMDESFDELDGLTPFQVTQQYGFPCHKSQHWTWFYKWIYGKNGEITKAEQILTYNPALYGCVYTACGKDTAADDFFENVRSYGEIEEEQRLLAEELAKKQVEEEAKAAEEKLKEQQKLAEEKAAEEARIAAEIKAQEKKIRAAVCGGAGVLLLALISVVAVSVRRTRRKIKKRR